MKNTGGWTKLIEGTAVTPLTTIPPTAEAYSLIKRVSTVEKVSLGDLRTCLPLIRVGSEHWRGKSEIEKFSEWLSGSTPPPRCAADVGVNSGSGAVQCMEQCDVIGGYCNILHRCQSLTVCSYLRWPGSLCCASHRCNIANCAFERLEDGSYCTAHSCPCCVSESCRPILSRQPHACIKHQCAVVPCTGQALVPHIFCINHCCRECADSGSNSGMPIIDGSGLCRLHKCSAVNCNSLRINEELYCGDHICLVCAMELPQSEVQCRENGDCKVCIDHKCYMTDCDNIRLRSFYLNSNASASATATGLIVALYCLEHTCRICFLNGSDLCCQVEDDYPRNVCDVHPLCTRVTGRNLKCCKQAIPPNNYYCQDHVETKDNAIIDGDRMCCGITSKNKKCKVAAPSGAQWWCPAHIKQARPQEVIIEINDYDDGYDNAVKDSIRAYPEEIFQKPRERFVKIVQIVFL